MIDPALDHPLVVDEYVFEKRLMPGQYDARLAIRYDRPQFAAALSVAFAFVNTHYANVVVMGYSGSRNGDQIQVFFWSSGTHADAAARRAAFEVPA